VSSYASDPYGHLGGSSSSGDPYSRSSGYSSDPYGHLSGGSTSKKKNGSFFGNLIGDPISAAVGFIPALYHLGSAGVQDVHGLMPGISIGTGGVHVKTPHLPTHVFNQTVAPLAQDPFVVDIGRGIRHPLRESSIYAYATGGKQPKSSQLVSDIKQGHLFVPALDALAVASFGAARVGALGMVGERAPGVTANQAIRSALVRGRHSKTEMGTISVKDSPTGAPIVTRTLPRNVYQAGRMKAVDRALKAVTHEAERYTGKPWGSFPMVGESARAARAVERTASEVKLAHLSDPHLIEYQQAFSKLNKNQRVALNTLARVPMPDDLEGWKAILKDEGGDQAEALLERLKDPKMRAIYDDPRANKKMSRALDAAIGVVSARENILFRTGALTPEAAEAAAYGATRVARGAEYVDEATYNQRLSDIDSTLKSLGSDITETVKGARTIGKPEIRAETAVANELGRAAGRSSKIRGKYRQVVVGLEAAQTEASKLNAQVKEIAGGTIDTSTLSDLNIKVSGAGPDTNVGRAFADAEQRTRTDALHTEAANLRNLIRQLEAGEVDVNELSKLGVTIRAGGNVDRYVATALTTAKRRLAAAEKGLAKETPPIVAAGLEQGRLRALGILYDRLGPAYDKLERKLAAAHGLEREMAHGEELAIQQGRSASAIRRAREARIQALQAERAALEEFVSLRRSMEMLRGEIEAGGYNKLVGGGTPEEIRADLEAAGRPQPFYTPDVPAGSRQSRQAFSKSGGRTPPTSDVKGSRRILFRMGQVALHPDLLTPSFLRAAAFDAKIAKHEKVKEIATPIGEGEHLPADMEWVREVRGERIPFTLSSAGEHLAEMEKVFPEDKPLTIGRDGTGNIAVDAEGRRLAVSRKLAKQLEAEVHKEGLATKWLLQKPIDVWRALVLNLRIPWLINNIVGNQLLYALRFAGVDGLKAYVGMLPLPMKQRLFKALATSHLTKEDVAEIFPSQVRGTLIETQTPASLGAGFIRKAVRVLGGGLAPLDRRSEQALRRASLEAVLRGSPEVKAIYRAMPKETRSLREAMRQAAKGNEDLRRLANTEANRALGDYLSLSPAEQTYMRRIAPFYGWYREILRIATHAVVDTPVRVALLSKLSILEEQRQQDQRGIFPSYLEGSIGIGNGPQGTKRILTTRALNPFSTIADEIRIANLARGMDNRAGANALIGTLNPYGSAAGAYLFRASQGDPNDPSYLGPVATQLSKLWAPGQLAAQVVGGLPQVQAAAPPPPSRLYPTRSREDLLWRLLGDIRRDVNLQQAHLYGTQGR